MPAERSWREWADTWGSDEVTDAGVTTKTKDINATGELAPFSPEQSAVYAFSAPNLPMQTPGSVGNHPEDRLIHIMPMVNRVWKEFQAFLSERISQFTRLNTMQLLAMGVICQAQEEDQSISPGEVAYQLGISNAAVTTIMKTLEDKELCARIKRPGTKTKSLVVTDKGARVLQQVASLMDSLHDQFHGTDLQDEVVHLAKYIIDEYRAEGAPSCSSCTLMED